MFPKYLSILFIPITLTLRYVTTVVGSVNLGDQTLKMRYSKCVLGFKQYVGPCHLAG